MAGIKQLMGLMQQAATSSPARKAAAPKAAAGDQLGGFLHQLKSGGIKPNLNQPALPYTSRGRLNLIG